MARDFEAELAAAREQGRALGIAEASGTVATFEALARSLQEERAKLAEGVEQEAVELAVAIAEKILGGAFEADPELVLESVRGALRRVVERQDVTVLVNPEDLEIVRDALPGLSVEAGGEISIRGERRVDRGGCQLRTAFGEIDARVAAQLERAREVVGAGPG